MENRPFPGFSRLTQVTTPVGKVTRYDYTFRGGLAWRRDGNGNVTKYQYDPLERLVSVTDSNDVELVKMDYDVLGNVTYVSNAHSVFQYTYDGLNRATQAVCLLTNIPNCSTVKYKIDYTFAPVGNVTNRLITGLQGFTDTIRTAYGYDVMNRLTNVVQLTNGVATANAWYHYDSAGRLWKKGYGNGDVVTQTYDSESRLLSMGITNGASPVTWFDYFWDVGGNILAITNNGNNIVLYGYDRAGQLTNEIYFTNGIAGGATNSWVYDEAGNWCNASSTRKWLYNTDNELIAKVPSATPDAPSGVTTTVTGEVEPGPNSNKWYNTSAECKGVQAQVSTTDGSFSLSNVPIDHWGENILTVTVTDVSGNSSQQARQVYKQVTNANETFRYDGNGNLTNWISGSTDWVYEWDWADRLTRVSSTNGNSRLENWYDSSSRRIAKADPTGRKLYLNDGWEIVGVLSSTGSILETFTRGVGIAGDIGTIVAVTPHVTISYPYTVYTHHNHRGDVIMARHGTLTATTYAYSAFGMLLAQNGPNVCRFNFSSKETETWCPLIYYGYRFYAPLWQRWVNPDPVGEAGGMNLYLFVANSPILRQDSDGSDETPQAPGPRKWPPVKKPPQPPIEGDKAIKKFLNECAKDIYKQHKSEIEAWLKDHPTATVAGVAAYIAYMWTDGKKIECPMIPISKSCKVGGWIQSEKGGGGVDGGGIKIRIEF